jgi:acetyl-CoA/propionyl-CoA carboxylase biotin carboxyl carrier protein
MFQRVLIANRGEIAVRIARTLRRLGIESVAVHSTAETNAMHVRMADRSFEIGPASPRRSYLVAERIIEAAKQAGADAIHPGYGFLSENPEFAATVRAAGIAFIGPSEHAIRTMGDKSAARAAAIECGVAVVPGRDIDPDEPLSALAANVGLPLMLKAVAGGGGRGMRKIESVDDLDQGMVSASREAEAAFGDGRIYAERAIERARHIEVQIVGDQFGQIAFLGERDCSVQRRHQKVVEESPSPVVTPELRERLGRAATTVARHVSYENAGTVEFLFDPATAEFFFLEMNTRLQVEHGVTELVAGLDLVEIQLRVAAGERLDAELVSGPSLTGHAIEFRLYAEEPARNYLPSPGRISSLQFPPEPVRVDSGVEAGDEVTQFYDPMIAKVLVSGTDRAEALAAARRALSDTRVEGIHTNLKQLLAIANHPDFVAGNVATTWLEAAAFQPELDPDERKWLLSALAVAMHRGVGAPKGSWQSAGTAGTGPATPRFVRLPDGELVALATTSGEEPATLSVSNDANEWVVRFELSGAGLTVAIGSESRRYSIVRAGPEVIVSGGMRTWRTTVSHPPPLVVERAGDKDVPQELLASLSGEVVRVDIKEGQEVAVGQALVVLQAMKMEHVLTAPRAGLVRSVECSVGDHVGRGDVLVRFGGAGLEASR